MSITDSLKVALSELAANRNALQFVKAALADRRAEFDATNADLIASVKTIGDGVLTSEAQVRALTLAAYEMDPTTTKPVEGVSVITSTTYEYAPEQALAWVKASAPHLLIESYDVASVKKAAQAGLLPFAVKTETPSVRIASDLTEYTVIPEPTRE